MNNRRRTLLRLLLIVLLMVPLVGCYDRVELEGVAFVISMGADKGPDNTIDVTAYIALPRKMAGGGGGGGGGGGDEGDLAAAKPITVRARSIPQALDLLNTTVERRISLTHLSNFGLTDRLARDGFMKYVRPLTRYREFRRTVFMFVTPGSMREMFEKNKPVVEMSLTRFTESLADVGRFTGMTSRQYFHEFLVSIEAPNKDPIAPVIAVNPNAHAKEDGTKGKSGPSGDSSTSGESGGSSDSSSGDKPMQKGEQQGEREGYGMPSFKPGKVVRRGGNNLEFIGTAVFRQDKLVTYLDGIETRMMLTLRGELQRTEMDFPDPINKGEFVSVELKHARAPVVQVNLDSQPVTISIKQSLEGDLVGGQGTTDYTQPKNMSLLEANIRKRMVDKEVQLINTIYHQYQADPFAIFSHTRGKFKTYQEFETYDFRKAMKTAKVDVDVDVKLRRVGVQQAPAVAK